MTGNLYTQKVEDTEAEFDFTKLAEVSKDDAKPNKVSSQDNSTYKVRYSYGPVEIHQIADVFVKEWSY